MKANEQNEKIKREFSMYMKEAKGHGEKSINNYKKAIYLYEECFNFEDFTKYTSKKAISFKDWLKQRKTLSESSMNTYLRYLRKFFTWLATQNQFINKITPDQIEYLQLDDKTRRIANQIKPREHSTLEEIINLTNSFKIENEIDMRDKALISFTLISGMRIKAISTLSLGCIDTKTLLIYQNPKKGVETKFAKNILSLMLNFNNDLLKNVLDWIEYLKTHKQFKDTDPLFPISSKKQNNNNLSFVSSTEVEANFFKGTNSLLEIFKLRAKNANLKYYSPHSYRHLSVEIAFKYCINGEQIKAISQHFGHEHVATTLSAYANYDNNKLYNILKNIDFSGNPQMSNNDLIEQMKKMINKNNS